MNSPPRYIPVGPFAAQRGTLDMLLPVRWRWYRGDDHLLLVKKSVSREHYHRLYYRDIQALIWLPTNHWIWYQVLCWVPALLFGIIAAATRDRDGFYFSGAVAVLLALLAVANLAQGRTCRAFLKTPIQQIDLPHIHRQRDVQRMLSWLRPLILAHQRPASPSPEAPPSSTSTPSA